MYSRANRSFIFAQTVHRLNPFILITRSSKTLISNVMTERFFWGTERPRILYAAVTFNDTSAEANHSEYRRGVSQLFLLRIIFGQRTGSGPEGLYRARVCHVVWDVFKRAMRWRHQGSCWSCLKVHTSDYEWKSKKNVIKKIKNKKLKYKQMVFVKRCSRVCGFLSGIFVTDIWSPIRVLRLTTPHVPEARRFSAGMKSMSRCHGMWRKRWE